MRWLALVFVLAVELAVAAAVTDSWCKSQSRGDRPYACTWFSPESSSGCPCGYASAKRGGEACCTATPCTSMSDDAYYDTQEEYFGCRHAQCLWQNAGCSVFCGTGTMRQTRDCGSRYDNSRNSGSCTGAGEPKQWASWGSYGACSTACGTGVKTRSRKVTGDCGSFSPSISYDTESCTAGTPRYWGQWQSWEACDTKCGTAFTRRTRSVLGDCGSSPTGANGEVASCSVGTPYYWTAWGSYSDCSSTCGAGVQYRLRECLGNCGNACYGVSLETTSCTVGIPYSWSSWSAWSSCNNTCGSGVTTRTRTCVGTCGDTCPPDVSWQSQPCSSGTPRSWTAWYDWGDCNAPCGKSGQQTRTRICFGTCGSCPSTDSSTQTQFCLSSGIQKAYSTWTPWTTTCSTNCGNGTRTRIRLCEGTCDSTDGQACADESSQQLPCANGVANTWSEWAPASSCSVSCGTGVQKIKRTCGEGTCGDCGQAEGSLVEMRVNCTSGFENTWSAWGAWSACSTVCGIGQKTRSRSCSGGCWGDCGGVALAKENTTCSEGRARALSEWSDWTTVCSTSCGTQELTLFLASLVVDLPLFHWTLSSTHSFQAKGPSVAHVPALAAWGLVAIRLWPSTRTAPKEFSDRTGSGARGCRRVRPVAVRSPSLGIDSVLAVLANATATSRRSRQALCGSALSTAS
eukprot:m.743510 g.743510  ORF g.743510 m.743510 type:complete len:684 (+) comp58945_c0_seq10:41-2092(+)